MSSQTSNVVSQAPVQPVVLNPLAQQKSAGAGSALTIFFGPFGALYAGAAFGLIWLLITFAAAFFTWGFSILLTWPLLVLWTAVKISKDNANIDAAHRALGDVQRIGVISRTAPGSRQECAGQDHSEGR